MNVVELDREHCFVCTFKPQTFVTFKALGSWHIHLKPIFTCARLYGVLIMILNVFQEYNYILLMSSIRVSWAHAEINGHVKRNGCH